MLVDRLHPDWKEHYTRTRAMEGTVVKLRLVRLPASRRKLGYLKDITTTEDALIHLHQRADLDVGFDISDMLGLARLLRRNTYDATIEERHHEWQPSLAS